MSQINFSEIIKIQNQNQKKNTKEIVKDIQVSLNISQHKKNKLKATSNSLTIMEFYHFNQNIFDYLNQKIYPVILDDCFNLFKQYPTDVSIINLNIIANKIAVFTIGYLFVNVNQKIQLEKVDINVSLNKLFKVKNNPNPVNKKDITNIIPKFIENKKTNYKKNKDMFFVDSQSKEVVDFLSYSNTQFFTPQELETLQNDTKQLPQEELILKQKDQVINNLEKELQAYKDMLNQKEDEINNLKKTPKIVAIKKEDNSNSNQDDNNNSLDTNNNPDDITNLPDNLPDDNNPIENLPEDNSSGFIDPELEEKTKNVKPLDDDNWPDENQVVKDDGETKTILVGKNAFKNDDDDGAEDGYNGWLNNDLVNKPDENVNAYSKISSGDGVNDYVPDDDYNPSDDYPKFDIDPDDDDDGIQTPDDDTMNNWQPIEDD